MESLESINDESRWRIIIDNATNEADLPEAPTLTNRVLVKAAVLAVMACASILANLSTLVSIAISKKGRGSTLYTLLFQVINRQLLLMRDLRLMELSFLDRQLAVADLLVSTWCLSGEAVWTYTVEWKSSQMLCKIFKFSQVSLINSM